MKKQSLSAQSEQQQVHQSKTAMGNRLVTSKTQNFVDNRPETIAQRQLANDIHAGPRIVAQRKLAGLIHNSPRMLTQKESDRSLKKPYEQLQLVPEKGPLQGKFEVVQREQPPAAIPSSGLPGDLNFGSKNPENSLNNLQIPLNRHVSRKFPAQLTATRMLPVAQLIRVGLVPSNPGNFRTYTTATGYGGGTFGGGSFNSSDLTLIENSNQTNAGNPPLPATNYPTSASDESGNALLDRLDSRVVAPEVDHIVPKKDGGANDLDNARMLSKAENKSPGTSRPTGGQRDMRLYQPITITNGHYVANGPVAAGTDLSVAAVKELARYAGSTVPGSMAAVSKTTVDDILTQGVGVTKGGVTIN
ncbi:MAG: HNH endonuclease [Proteobacteria bacterium]|nr:HNH endonuclease [Pseudomonadota bacterium]